MDAEWTLRPATGDDHEFLWRLHRETMREYVEATWGWDEADQRERFRREFIAAEGWQVIVVAGEDAGRLVTERRGEDVYVANVQVRPDLQGRGIGTAVLRRIIGEAAREGLGVSLQVLRANRAARRLYERLGFAAVREDLTHAVMRRPPDRGP